MAQFRNESYKNYNYNTELFIFILSTFFNSNEIKSLECIGCIIKTFIVENVIKISK
jgi:hypothetical protein